MSLISNKDLESLLIEENLSAEYYMDLKRRGRCLIFNHEKFDIEGLKTRSGSEADVEALEKAFNSLGFVVDIYQDLTKKDLLGKLKEVSDDKDSQLPDVDCLVVCLMTHGNRHSFYAKDGGYSKEKLWELFLTDKCPALAFKPKLFFIQACRGDKSDQSMLVSLNDDEKGRTILVDDKSEPPEDSDLVIGGTASNYLCFGTMLDILLSFSSAEGFISHRSSTSGCPYIQYLASLLKQNGAKYDILVLLRKLTLLVGTRECKKDPQEKKYLPPQTPFFTSSLTKAVIFREKKGMKIESFSH